jgi:regulator of protease activity HflC (stomatin/prohibitin superfamily)
MLNQAEAEKRAAILKAEGAFEVRRLEGEAIAAQRNAIVTGLRQITGDEQDDLSLTQTMIIMAYLDVMQSAASHRNNTFIMSCTPGGIAGIEQDLATAMRANMAREKATVKEVK